MARPPTLGEYVWEAFCFRPYGMFVPPNWVALAAVGMVATVMPGVGLIGLGLEVAYLLSLVSHPGWRRAIERRRGARDSASEEKQLEIRLRELGSEGAEAFRRLRELCEEVLAAAPPDALPEVVAHETEAMERLMQVYLRLLRTGKAVARLLDLADPTVAEDLRAVRQRLAQEGLSDELRTSLDQQQELLTERLRGYQTAEQRQQHVHAEMRRIEQQVALWREQRLLDATSSAVTGRIDELLGTLKTTGEWLHEQRVLVGDDPTEDAPVPVRQRARQAN